MPSTSVDPSAFDVLAQTPATLRALLSAVPQDVVEAPADEGWSPKDVVAHLLANHPWAMVNRVRLMLDEDDPPVPDVDEQVALDDSGLRPKPLDELLDELELRRAEAVAWLRELTPEQLGRTGRHEVAGEISIADLLHHLAYHDLLHVEQAARMLQGHYEPLRGGMRAF